MMKDFAVELYAADRMRQQGQLLLAADKLEQLLFQAEGLISPQFLCAAYSLLGACSGALGRSRIAT